MSTLETEQQSLRQTGLDVISNEAETIANLASSLDENFTKACQLLLNCKGHVIIIGMGKSGHIANKIAATFASTGTPAFFVHPAEANHGDMGMITKNDVVFTLSNSGETSELISLLPQIKRLNIPMISLTGDAQSTLAKASTITLEIAIEQEACPLGLAPTTSTTAMLVMGDAFAIALLKARGLTQTEFASFHPAGALGKRLTLKVGDIMHTGQAIPKVDKNTPLSEALVEMTKKRLGMTAIVDEHNQPIGIYTDGDLRRTLTEGIDVHETAIHAVMSSTFKTTTPEMLAWDALQIMETHKITVLLVIGTKKTLAGVIHLHHILSNN